jgi:hypothetical protein
VVPFLTWLIQGGVGPAVVALPVNWGGTDLARAAKRWFQRLRRSDGLSRIVRAATGGVGLSDAEFAAVRRLLEKESTWVGVGRRSVEDLASRIASCLPDRAGEGSVAAGWAIAAGLLEFAVRDLEPEWFQQVLFARLDRMQADQASALDRAMLSVHADLVALLAHQDAANAERHAQVMGQLARVLDQLPPGPADRAEVAVYLATLIKWLDSDPWLQQDTRFAGSVPTPATIERRLRIASSLRRGEQDLDADDLVRQCTRLVVLGGPGSGKTWLAKRAARLCAEAALDTLTADGPLEEVELPLYTTCARLRAEPPGDGIRRAVVSSALGHLPDLGGSRVHDALRALFEDRNAPTLLVADSLDEARGADDRIRQADWLLPAWRIVLTSRPAWWKRQLAIGDDDPSRRVGVLQPLHYPGDVEPFIADWFRGRPARSAELAAQLRYRPALQQAATVPLILAFYCIVGGDQPLPDRSSDLYTKVIRRMLTGCWRGSGEHDPDPEACLEVLRDWACSAAVSDPVSGIGVWADEFATLRVRQSKDDRDALDHVASPLGPPDVDTGMTLRRFVHRSLREHVVAEHVIQKMTAEEAAQQLLNHVWYDRDWEYAAPAALAMRPDRDQVLTELICRAARSRYVPDDLAGIDGCWELRRFLARVAAESCEADWAAESVSIIGRARMDLAANDLLSLPPASGWPATNSQIRRELLAQLEAPSAPPALEVWTLARALARLDLEQSEMAQARGRVLDLLDAATESWEVDALTDALVRLGREQSEMAQARARVLDMFDTIAQPWEVNALGDALVRLDPTQPERTQARASVLDRFDASHAKQLAGALGKLGIDPLTDLRGWTSQLVNAWAAPPGSPGDDPRRAWITAEAPLPGITGPPSVVLAWLDNATDPASAHTLAETLASIRPGSSDSAHARARLLDLLDHATSPRDAATLADALTKLDPDSGETAQARGQVLGLLATAAKPQDAVMLAETLRWLGPKPAELAQARGRVLGLLAAAAEPSDALMLADALPGLGPEPPGTAQARAQVLNLLRAGSCPQAKNLAELLAELSPVADDLLGWASWGVAPPPALLAAARRNSPLQSWLDVLPVMADIR